MSEEIQGALGNRAVGWRRLGHGDKAGRGGYAGGMALRPGNVGDSRQTGSPGVRFQASLFPAAQLNMSDPQFLHLLNGPVEIASTSQSSREDD